MQQKIKILDPHEAIKIAAGEVIERPAHIIKELAENSIDAGAKNISLYIESAGKNSIKIVDDGCGMSADDAVLCFAHHATSKITTVNDLQHIATFGFRGEALSSIASMSSIVLTTRSSDEKIGTCVTIEYGKIVSVSQVAHQVGTTILINNIFGNMPARKKFLKSDDTEWNAIVSMFQAFCLKFLTVHFKLFHNTHLAYNCSPSETMMMRCAQLWSGTLHDRLLNVSSKPSDEIVVAGVISKADYYRFNRGQIFIFVNNRWVKNQEVVKGVLQGYDGVLPHQKYPAAFIAIEIDPELVDINVHPKKEEVKFLHPAIVQRVICNAVKAALNNVVTQSLPIKVLHAKPDLELIQALSGNDELQDVYLTPSFAPTLKASGIRPLQPVVWDEFAKTESVVKIQSSVAPSVPAPIQNQSVLDDQQMYSIIGQYKRTYIIVEQDKDLLLVDQHAAHERIIYQRLVDNHQPTETVSLLFPHMITLDISAMPVVFAQQALLRFHGILIDQFSDNQIIIQATPVGMNAAQAQEIIQIVIDTAHEKNDSQILQFNEKIMCAKACKMACRAGDVLDIAQMNSLIKQLLISQDRFCCPHGRPTIWSMALTQIEKHFKRDYVGSKQKNNF